MLGRNERAGLLHAVAVVPGSFARSLLPRSTADQAVVTATTTGLTYLLGVLVGGVVDLVAVTLSRGLRMDGADRGDVQPLVLAGSQLGVALATGALARLLPPRADEHVARGLLRQGAAGATRSAGAGAAVLAAQWVAGTRLQRGSAAAARYVPAGVPSALALALLLEGLRVRSARGRPRSPAADGPDAPPVLSGAAALALVGAVTAFARAETLLADRVGQALAVLLPGPAGGWHLLARAGLPAAQALAALSAWQRSMLTIEQSASLVDPRLERLDAPASLSGSVSGSATSLVPWRTLGQEGRLHVLSGVRAGPGQAGDSRPDAPAFSIQAVMGVAHADPVLVYVGLDSAETAAAREELALAEMDRAGAWQCSLIVLVSPTGTGYVNYCATAALGYLTRGDVAMVTMQYSKRPSVLSLGTLVTAREQNRGLWLRVLDRVRALPEAQRPRVVLFGESLGAQTGQEALALQADGLRLLGVERALWLGTPSASAWTGRSLRNGGACDPAVAVVNDFGQLEELNAARRRGLRYVLLSHDNDGFTKFGVDLLTTRPPWLGTDRPPVQHIPGASPRGVPPAMRWRPLTTFVQVLLDLKNSQDFPVYRSWAHDYRPDLPQFLSEVFDLPATAAQLAAVGQALQVREETRERFLPTG